MNKPDRRDLPAYSLQESAQYLRVPLSTIRYWALGKAGTPGPIITTAGRSPLALSFYNLVELHVLGSMRRQFEVSMPRVRTAMDFVRGRLKVARPLISTQFETNGVDLFVQYCGQLLNVTREGQAEMRDVLQESLRRIERDPRGIPIRLYPFTRNELMDAPRLVVIDPDRSFGRPVIAGTGLVTAEIAARFKAGESFEALAEDYGRPTNEIAEAVRCELQAA
jgi:uncharacterized protein (DUF433 family)